MLYCLLDKGGNIIPILGTKKRKCLELNTQAINIELSQSELLEIESIIAKHPNTGDRYTADAMKLVDK